MLESKRLDHLEKLAFIMSLTRFLESDLPA